jgi:uncharacterized protein YndB with AHSA1/START domain
MSEPFRLSFEVACAPEHAFRVWTTRISSWWPRDHTVSGQADAEVVLQGRVGGRIYERTPDGAEHEWGEVARWEPPTRLGYVWHIGQDRANATDVEIRFSPQDNACTRVDIEHGGWQRLGSVAEERRAQNRRGWDALVPEFVAAIAKGEG